MKNKEDINIGFLLLEHFSMMSYTAAMDALATSNLIQSNIKFRAYSFSLTNNVVTSDLGINIDPSTNTSELMKRTSKELSHMIICGGLRCSIRKNLKLDRILKTASKNNITLGGIWNGIIPLAQAGLIDNSSYALHLNNRPFMQENFPSIQISDKNFVVDSKCMSSSNAIGTLDMMLSFVGNLIGLEEQKEVRDVLSCSRSKSYVDKKLTKFGGSEALPNKLLNIIKFMHSNIEEPMTVEEISKHLNISRRKMERLFKVNLNISPSRYYLKTRLNYATKLLVQTDDLIINISLASGFVNSNHFSNSFRKMYNLSPKSYRLKHTISSNVI
jgi:transcriptional regulator GlxA family with amidase domain